MCVGREREGCSEQSAAAERARHRFRLALCAISGGERGGQLARESEVRVCRFARRERERAARAGDARGASGEIRLCGLAVGACHGVIHVRGAVRSPTSAGDEH